MCISLIVSAELFFSYTYWQFVPHLLRTVNSFPVLFTFVYDYVVLFCPVLLLACLVSFLAAVMKYPDESNLEEQGYGSWIKVPMFASP